MFVTIHRDGKEYQSKWRDQEEAEIHIGHCLCDGNAVAKLRDENGVLVDEYGPIDTGATKDGFKVYNVVSAMGKNYPCLGIKK